MAPTLFNILIDGIFSLQLDSDLTLVGYADDLSIIAPLPSDDAIEALQVDLDRITAFYTSVGLALNVQKSKVLLCAVSPNVNFTNVYFKLYDVYLLLFLT